MVQRTFIKNQSVWNEWRSDDYTIIKRCIDHDFRAWKGSRFVKSKADLIDLENIITQNFEFLKAEHISQISQSNFPSSTLNQMTIYAKKAKFIDKNVNQACLDRLFIAANVESGEEPAGGDNPDGALVRYEFLEFLARIAQEKYQKTGIVNTCAEAFQMLIERNLLPISEVEKW